MNWAFVLIGNLIMDSAIVIFAILSGLEASYRREAEKEEIKNLIEKKESFSDKSKISEWLSKKYGVPKKSIRASIFPDITGEEQKDDTDGVMRVWGRKLNTSYWREQADWYSPIIGIKFPALLIMFLSGIALQILGIFFDNIF